MDPDGNNYGRGIRFVDRNCRDLDGLQAVEKSCGSRSLAHGQRKSGRTRTCQPKIGTLSAPAFRYAPLVKYVYHVNGKELVNDFIHPKRIQLPEHSTKKWAQKRAESFADEVTVHYNPADPSESFLVQTPKRKLYILIGCSCVALLFGVMFLLPKITNP